MKSAVLTTINHFRFHSDVRVVRTCAQALQRTQTLTCRLRHYYIKIHALMERYTKNKILH